ncbi:MAG: hypothetical protein ABIT83_00555 [Massilia sp.]
MKEFNVGALMLRVRLGAARLGPLACGALLLCVAGAAALAWLLPQRALQQRQHAVVVGLAALPPPPAPLPPPVSANENLALFYDVLGEQRYAEQQVKTLFGLASKAGLSLSQGEYKSSYDKHAHVHAYQVTLPVKGSYNAIWQFGLLALRAIPFASLDEISFKRDNIGNANVEARMRLTIYLSDQPPGERS